MAAAAERAFPLCGALFLGASSLRGWDWLACLRWDFALTVLGSAKPSSCRCFLRVCSTWLWSFAEKASQLVVQRLRGMVPVIGQLFQLLPSVPLQRIAISNPRPRELPGSSLALARNVPQFHVRFVQGFGDVCVQIRQIIVKFGPDTARGILPGVAQFRQHGLHGPVQIVHIAAGLGMPLAGVL